VAGLLVLFGGGVVVVAGGSVGQTGPVSPACHVGDVERRDGDGVVERGAESRGVCCVARAGVDASLSDCRRLDQVCWYPEWVSYLALR
jgi:hypothetical protein